MGANFGKINLTAFKNAQVILHQNKKGVFIPIEDNFLFEAKNGNIYVDIVNFETDKLRPYTHIICRSLKKEHRAGNEFKTKIGGIKL